MGRKPTSYLCKAVRRDVVRHLQDAYGIGERRVCYVTGFHRSSQRYRSRRDPQVELRVRLNEMPVPDIDLGPVLAGDAAGARAVHTAVDEALRTVGFMTIGNHGVPEALAHRLH